MVHADLHVHTTNSDGTLSLAELPRAAEAAGVAVVGVTDHDRVHPGLDDPLTVQDGITIVHGIELRVETPEQRVDLLGYGVDSTPALRAEVERLQRNRIERGRAIADRLEDRLGVSLDVDFEEGIGRPHLARAVVDHPETDYLRVESVFADLIGDDGPCFVPRDVPSFERGRDLLRDAAAVVGLAHPLRYPDSEAAVDHCASLDAIERYYPYDRDGGCAVDGSEGLLDRAIDRHDLLVTGGSDAHDDVLGRAGLDRDEWTALADRLQ
ncbi:MAG: PHP domain-containing protein [Halodesulfurarchaeum sp.]